MHDTKVNTNNSDVTSSGGKNVMWLAVQLASEVEGMLDIVVSDRTGGQK
jgi:hypothetical protein